ncbi:MAG TPA: DUF2085 domain-containing protein [Vicinamibacterales bacterium]|jgi:uncharacterized membrane protein
MMYGARLLVGLALVWTAALFAAPAAIASPDRTLSQTASLVYLAGGIVCHQRPERSFTEHGHPLPVCARCTGLYVSAVIGGVLALAAGRRQLDRASARWILGVASVPTAATWLAEAAGLAHPSNMVRSVAALSLGAAAAWVVVTVTANDRV